MARVLEPLQRTGKLLFPRICVGSVDETDAAILRELNRDRAFLWGGIDPRVGTSQIATRLRMDRTTVWARLKAWEREGFLIRHEVLPNPKLFGAGVAGGSVRVDDPLRKPEVLRSLELVHGVLGWIDQVGEWIGVGYANEAVGALDRCTRLVGQLPGVAEVSTCVPFVAPDSILTPTDRDWRILAALRAMPTRPLDDVAEAAGVSRRTFTRRYQQLLDARAVWSFPLLDFSHYRGATMARFLVIFSGMRAAASLVSAARRKIPGVVYVDALEKLAPGQDHDHPWADLYCHLRSAGETEDVCRWLLAQPNVADVELYFPRRWSVVPAWFDERIHARMGRSTRAK